MKRYLPESPLPPYSYVPGMHVHPISHPSGHSYQQPAPTIDLPDDLRRCISFVRGLDLFNAGYYWEAHQAWEAVWQAQRKRGAAADPIKGLIKLAAAGVKARQGSTVGVARHAARALQLLVADDDAILPIDVDAARRLARLAAARPEALINVEPAAVRIVFATSIALAE